MALMSSTTAWAGGVPWTVSESSGPVSVMHAGLGKVVQRGGTLAIGDVVATGARGRAVLVRGQEYLVVSPNSRISIADPAQSGGFIQIIQNWGSAIFKIEKKTEKHFAVKTPYLAAVVKGTTFNVTVDDNGARVQVTEGRVEVATPDGKAMSMVMPGEVGLVSASDTMRLRVQGIESRVIDSPLRGSDPAPAAKEARPEAAETPAKPAESVAASEAVSSPQQGEAKTASASRAAADVASNVSTGKPNEASPDRPVRITAAIGEGAVNLAMVTSGLVRGDSTLIATVKPVQVAFATAVTHEPEPPVSSGPALDESPAHQPDPAVEAEIVAKPPVDSPNVVVAASPGNGGSGDPGPAEVAIAT
ncbi:MAG: hypothetical protein RL367_1683, partial [Pseudomonadota bacterium]